MNAIGPNKRVILFIDMKDGEPNKRKQLEAEIKGRARLLNESVKFWEDRMEIAFVELEKFDYLESDPFCSEALEISDEDTEKLNDIYEEIAFLNLRCNLEIKNMVKLEKEIENFIDEHGE